MRTRFPPSPTGFLHIGALRTALFNYLVARKAGGTFIMRIEDIDREREVAGAVEDFLTTMHWAGVNPDEGVMLDNGVVIQRGKYGPYIQSERLELYKKNVVELIETACAYYAFDTKEDLERMREEETKAGNPSPKYDASVRMRMRNSLTLPAREWKAKLEAGEPYAVRMQVPEGNVVRFTDEIRGNVEFRGMEIDDQILLKSDGFPTYHLANVVDDHLMQIDMVIRGEEWLSSTPKHLLLYEYFGWKAPVFAHVPLLLNKGGGKLSKRQGDVSVRDYIEKGYLPEAVINFIVMLGWNAGTTQEIFTMDELVEQFTLERVQKGGAVFDPEKLLWFQGQWIRRIPKEEFAERIRPVVAERYSAAAKDPDFTERAGLIQERITFFPEAPEMLALYYVEPKVTDDLLVNAKQKLDKKTTTQVLNLLENVLDAVSGKEWNTDHLKDLLMKEAEKNGLKTGQMLWPLRAALTGLPFSPGAFEVAAALGKETTIKRLKVARKAIS